MENKFVNTRLEFHILQSFPVSCLNRDDVGAPKSAFIGGQSRARVSSQCWKRAVRLALQELGVKIADRTKLVANKITQACIGLGASEEAALACGECSAKAFTSSVKNGLSDTLLFISESEVQALAQAFAAKNFDPEAISAKELQKLTKNALKPARDGLDIALFGRMVAEAAEMNVEAAASFAHAISTHRVANEIDFFTAVDDCQSEEQSGSAHMGTQEFNSATYYRYVSLDLGQLCENLQSEDIEAAVSAFIKALFIAVPAARQAVMSAACSWDFARVLLRRGQRLQLSFHEAVTSANMNESLLAASKKHLLKQLEEKEKMFGSLFGKISEQSIGIGSESSIDDIIDEVTRTIKDLQEV